jgi:DNA-binding response OmpR family regulator
MEAMLPTPSPIATVVVCEDDPPTLELLCDNLVADAYDPLPAPTASDALRLCHFKQPDLLLLDILLPDASGLDVLREIRAGGGGRFDSELPVIVLSGKSEDADRVRGIEVGADDFIVKPAHYPELLARIGAVLRRRRCRGVGGPIRIGDLRVDPVTRSVRMGEREVELANLEFELLLKLASEPTRVFTKRELLEQVWGYRSEGRTRTVDSHASRLRMKLDPDHRRFVINCWGVGYRLCEG